MQCNYVGQTKKPWIEYVTNEENTGKALAQNFLLHHDLDDKVISKNGDQLIYVSDALSAFKKFNKTGDTWII